MCYGWQAMKDLTSEIRAVKEEWGERLLILGHHYQRSSVLQHADEIGDSLELSRTAGAHPKAERIVFCGVRFMAESADILTQDSQTVYMPEMTAGCPMADMATAEDLEKAWELLGGTADDWLPVVYVNSSAALKAGCGRLGGSTCTSSNAQAVFEWAFKQNKRVFFLPDEHLGVNTAADLGIPDSDVVVYDPKLERGGLADTDIARARVIVWKGFCIVHQAFTTQQIDQVRQRFREAQVIVHPESPKEVVRAADAHGSTSQIIQFVRNATAGSMIAVGTEVNLIQRLSEEERGRVSVKALAPSVCTNMAKTSEQNLLSLLTEWPEIAQVHVPDSVTEDARRALDRMLAR